MPSTVTRNTCVALVTHELFYGAPQALRDYLNTIPIDSLFFISHPINRENQYSYRQHFFSGKLSNQKRVTSLKAPLVIEYFIHEALTLWWILQSGKIFDMYVGVNPLNCFAGIICRRLGRVQHVIFYAIDFTPKRFKNTFLNFLYHHLELFCVTHSDERWDVSPRIAEGREKYLGFSKLASQKVVPIGVWKRDIVSISRIKKNTPVIIFVGHILKKQGIQMVIQALPRIANKIQNISFLIVGDGEYRIALEKLVKHLRLTNRVVFHGIEHNQDTINSLLSASALSVACYETSGSQEQNFTYYADPTKIKTYLASGLPVIMTDVSYNAAEIQRKRCGIVVDYDKEAIAHAIIELLQNNAKRKEYRMNAMSYMQKYSWETIFQAAFSYEK